MFDDLRLSESPHAQNLAAPVPAGGLERGAALLTEQALGQYQRESTLAALTQTNGKVSGAGGAAELLGIKPTTLASRLQKWGIDSREFRKKRPPLSSTPHALD